jgi:PAS domain S-box-containing protein
MKKILSISVKLALLPALLLLPATAERVGADIAKEAPALTRVVAVIPPDAPPTYYLDEQTGKAAGFAVDIMDAVAARAGLSTTYVFEDGWADIIEMMKNGKADLAPGMGVSKERDRDLAFSAPIDAFPISFFVRAEHPGIEASSGVHTVGVIRGSVAFEKLKDRANIQLARYEGFPQGLFDLLAGKIEAFACPAPTLWQLARETGVDDHIKVVDKPIAEITRAIAVRKNDTALLDRLNRAIEGYVGTPAYQQVYVKWYGKPVPYWTSARIISVGAALLLVMTGLMAGWRYLSLLRLNQRLAAAVVKRDEAVSAALLNQERLESLVKISQLRTENTQELLDFALEEAIRLTRSAIGYIYFYNEEKQEFTLNTWSREVMQACAIAEPQTIYQLEKTGIWGEAVRQRKTIVVQDFHAPHLLKKGYPAGHVPLHRFLTAPVFQEDRIVAVVGVANKQSAYHHDDINQLTLLMDAVWRMVELKRVGMALTASEKKYRMLYDSAIDAIFIADVDGMIIDVNRTAHERLGYAREEMLALHVSRLDPPDYAVQVGVRIEQLQQQGHLTFESAHRRKDGTIMPVEINARIIDYDGRRAIFSIARDITDRKQAEQEREKLIAELQQALAEIKTLHGILPICSSCKKIRDDKGAWQHLETYISRHTEAEFTHGLCADCAKKLYPEYMNKKA